MNEAKIMRCREVTQSGEVCDKPLNLVMMSKQITIMCVYCMRASAMIPDKEFIDLLIKHQPKEDRAFMVSIINF